METATTLDGPILLVAEETNIRLLDQKLTCAGYRTIKAATIAKSWRSAIEEKPFAVVADVSTGNWGWVGDLARGLAESAEVLVIMLVQRNGRQVRSRALSFPLEPISASRRRMTILSSLRTWAHRKRGEALRQRLRRLPRTRRPLSPST